MILYKYLTLARIDFWDSFLLRFTQPSAFNDPFDCLPSYSFLPSNLMPQNAGSDDLASLFMGIENETVTFNDERAIFCMSESWDSILMWAHYADSHSGFVVGFDVSHPFFALGETFGTRKVLYCKKRPKFSDIKITDELYYKLDIWKYEQEWRLSKETYKNDKIVDSSIYLFRIPKEAIQCVYFGICMPEESKREIYSKVEKLKIPCYQVMRDYQTFDLQAIELFDYYSMKQNYLNMKKVCKKNEVPQSEPKRGMPTKTVIINCLEKFAELLDYFVCKLLVETKKSYIAKAENFIQKKKKYDKILKDLNCFPNSFEKCDSTISRQIYEEKVKLIEREFAQCLYWMNRLLNIIQDVVTRNILPKTESYLSNQIHEKIGIVCSSFASAVAWAALFLDESELKKVVLKISFDDDFFTITADREGFRKGKKISARWNQMKQQELLSQNDYALKQYIETRTQIVSLLIHFSGPVAEYIQTYCPYIQGALPKRKDVPSEYKGDFSIIQQREILDFCFFIDVVQANGGFLLETETHEKKIRRQIRIREALVESGLEKQFIDNLMVIFESISQGEITYNSM